MENLNYSLDYSNSLPNYSTLLQEYSVTKNTDILLKYHEEIIHRVGVVGKIKVANELGINSTKFSHMYPVILSYSKLIKQ